MASTLSCKYRIPPLRSIPSIISLLGLSFFILSYTIFSRSSDLKKPSAGIGFEYSVPMAEEDPLVCIAAVDEGVAAMEEQASLLLDDAALNPSYASLLWDRIVKGRTEEDQRLESALVRLARSGHRIPILKASESFWRLKRIRTELRLWMQRRKTYDPTIMFSLLKQLKRPIDRFLPMKSHMIRRTDSLVLELRRKRTYHYESCAVVGNSGILLRSGYGELIDSHDAVIRLNYAQIEGFTEDVGKKTSMAFMNSNVLHGCRGERSCFCKPYGDGVPSLMYMCQPSHMLDAAFCSETEDHPLILVTDPRLDNLCNRIAKYYSVKKFVGAQNLTSSCRVEEDCMKKKKSKKMPSTSSQKLPESAMASMRHKNRSLQSHSADPALIHQKQRRTSQGMFNGTTSENCISSEASNRFQKVLESAMEEWSHAHDGPAFHYSSGLQAVVIALGICRNVSLFGFGRKSAYSQHHYYGPQQKAELRLHDYNAEYSFYRDLHNRNTNIPFISESGFPLPPLHIYS